MRYWLVVTAMAVGCASAPKESATESPAEASTDRNTAADTANSEEKLGSLPKETIRGVVRENMRDIQRCYDTELATHTDLAGKVVVTFKISKEGTIESASIAESDLDSRAVESCILMEVRGWEFPEPENDGVVIVNYPFNFKSP